MSKTAKTTKGLTSAQLKAALKPLGKVSFWDLTGGLHLGISIGFFVPGKSDWFLRGGESETIEEARQSLLDFLLWLQAPAQRIGKEQ